MNYLKLAIKVLRRNKFFTAISLFGISFTLLILMLVTAFYDAEFGENAPLSKKDRMVFVAHLKRELVNPDTIWTIDSTQMDGEMVYDSTYTIGENVTSTSISPLSYYFLDRFLRDVEDCESYTFFSPGHNFDVFLESRKLGVEALYVDASYWDLFDFSFQDGSPFTSGHVRDASSVAVITSELADQYFGTSEDVVGEEVTLADRRFKVIGVVDRARSTSDMVSSQVFLPLTTLDARFIEGTEYSGALGAAYLASRKKDIPLIKEELENRVAVLEAPDPEDFNRLSIKPMNSAESYAAMIINEDDPESALVGLRLIFGVLLALFVLLPTLNLINLNLSRIMEREAEIGVRKAFGAHSGTILYQFIFENVIITFIGGLIGMVLAWLVLYLINDSQVLPQLVLKFNSTVFLYSVIICFLFGIISGLLPAWRVSRLQIADVLKSNQL